MINIERYAYTPQGTFGILTVGDFKCFTVERPWLDNQSHVSCIPEGDYVASLFNSPKFGKVYSITGGTVSLFPDGKALRSTILIHPANTMDDLEGCIGLGKDHGTINSKLGVTNSVVTIKAFMAFLGGEDNIPVSITFKSDTASN